jgi:hypothetical protein
VTAASVIELECCCQSGEDKNATGCSSREKTHQAIVITAGHGLKLVSELASTQDDIRVWSSTAVFVSYLLTAQHLTREVFGINFMETLLYALVAQSDTRCVLAVVCCVKAVKGADPPTKAISCTLAFVWCCC